MDDIRNRRCNEEIEISMKYEVKETVDHTLSAKDKRSICLLIFLYVLQGIPLGLAGSVPLMLQSYKVSYSTQATFSFVFWPFSMKILWAPIVDSVFVSRWGRRKTWLVPVQLLIGVTMLLVSWKVPAWLASPPGEGAGPGEVAVLPLTASFFLMNMLAATQDIAVDGWALTMLSRGAVGWASTCNSVGQTSGYFIAFIVFLALESPDFCNSWLRTVPQATGFVTFSGFLYFWGLIFLAATILVAIFKTETQDEAQAHPGGDKTPRQADLTPLQTYATLGRILRLGPVRAYVLSLLLVKVGFSAADAVTGLKLVERGVSKEKMALIGALLVPAQVALAVLASRHTTGSRPLGLFVRAVPGRLAFGVVFAAVVWATPLLIGPASAPSWGYYGLLTLVYAGHQLLVYPMFVSVMAFYARVSDPAVGGTYMTLLNTVSNLSSNLPNTAMLYLVDYLTLRTCQGGPLSGQTCSSKEDMLMCTQTLPPGACETTVDGYYVEIAVCLVLGLVAFVARRRHLLQVDQLPLSAWKVSHEANGALPRGR